MGKDIVRRLRDMEKILGEMQDTGLGLMDSLLHDAFSLENFLRYAASLGIDLSQFPNLANQPGSPDPYQFLGLEKTATEAEVKKRYRKLVRVLHPDAAKTEGTNHLCQMLNEAYQQILKERGWR